MLLKMTLRGAYLPFTTRVNRKSRRFFKNIPFGPIALKVIKDYGIGMITLGDRVQRLITNKNYGQGEFADKIGIARSSLNRIIKGTKPLGKTNQKRIAQGLGLSLGLFLWLINSDIPLETLKVFQELAEIKDTQITKAIELMVTIGTIRDRGKIQDDDLAPLLQHIQSVCKLAKSLDK